MLSPPFPVRPVAPFLAAVLLFSCGGDGSSGPRQLAPVKVQALDPPSGPGALAPNLGLSGEAVTLTWLEAMADGHALRLARLEGDAWGPAVTVATGDDFFANWADLPQAVEAADGTLFAHWLAKLGKDTYAYGVRSSRSSDGGSTWRGRGLLHDDDSPTEHGFVSYVALPQGGVQAFWLDGRAMASGLPMQLRTTRLDGASREDSGRDENGPGPSALLDDRVCECCATDAALAAEGPVVVYRDRSASEVRDIAIIRSSADGWSQPTLIHDDGWQIQGCPVNGPAIAAAGDRVAVAWFTAGEDRARVQVACSRDGGVTFGDPVVVDDVRPPGRVDLALTPTGDAIVSWLGRTEDGAEIRWRRVADDGRAGPVRTVATTTASRSAGVPRMILRGDELLFVWVEGAEPSRLRAALVALPRDAEEVASEPGG